MKPTVAADEMFPEGVGPYMDLEEAGGPSNLLMDLAANEKAVHADFYNGVIEGNKGMYTRGWAVASSEYSSGGFAVLAALGHFEDLFDDDDLK